MILGEWWGESVGYAFPWEINVFTKISAGFKQYECPKHVLNVRKSPGSPNIHMHNVSGPHVRVGMGESPWSVQGITKPKINSDRKKNSSGHFI